jgi:hypothetical protein
VRIFNDNVITRIKEHPLEDGEREVQDDMDAFIWFFL